MVGTNASGNSPNAVFENFSGVVEIPEKVENNEIEAIGTSAFSKCEKITCVYINARIKIIYERAFADCCSLSYINVPSTVEQICDFGIHLFNFTGSNTNESYISRGTLVVVFEPNSQIKSIGSYNFDRKNSIVIHFSEPVYPKLGNSIFLQCARPIVICPIRFSFSGVISYSKSCTKCRKVNNYLRATTTAFIALIYN